MIRELEPAEIDAVSGGGDTPLTILNIKWPGGFDTFKIVGFALAMPEFPHAKPGSFQASFDAWEDTLERSTGIFGHTGGSFP